ncbi:hypothetical protein L0B53_18670 (plasmid) [Vibrio sp. SS-MA-C1-2]|uniref:hypothetical protein n=1 Tax=Vibrio sp. SS-MA-C1-2 TaxID=2908646 RepID=UPI001F2A942B|nr:hypothetical protein [Vibrio sp. SS-MA-C1-2]UJF20346.1 hypothetical protein L0B53_18670 [Vibrio sp. SS-MA-C1-2]
MGMHWGNNWYVLRHRTQPELTGWTMTSNMPSASGRYHKGKEVVDDIASKQAIPNFIEYEFIKCDSERDAKRQSRIVLIKDLKKTVIEKETLICALRVKVLENQIQSLSNREIKDQIDILNDEVKKLWYLMRTIRPYI